MKYRILGATATVLMLAAVVLAAVLSQGVSGQRVHQHLTARQSDAGCDCDGSELCTHLPLVIIDTGGLEIPGEPIVDENRTELGFTTTSEGEAMLQGSIRVMSSDAHNHHPSDEPDLESEILIRIRGNSSRYFDKKNYLLRLTSESGAYRNEEMMGMAPHYEWALHGPYLDKSLIRNYMWYNITGEFMEYAPNVRFCELILNGEYMGLYVMVETLTNGEDCRINVSEPIDGTNETGYLLRLDRGSGTPIKNIETFSNYAYRNLQRMDIQYPRSGDLTAEMADAIAQEFSDFEKSLYSYDYDTDDYGYYYDIDVQSFLDYFIINEFTTNYDAGWLSTYIYRDIGGKYKMVIWDFNSANNNYNQSTMQPQRFEMQLAVWFYMLCKDEYFVEHLISRYRELRSGVLSDAYLEQYIDDVVAYLGDAVERNFEVWGYTFAEEMVVPADRNPADHDQAVEMLKSAIFHRGAWMDENIDILLQYCHESKVKKFNH
ncbi:CotH kinase family protein [uncultured Flavonifractor sp.]|uniref:CotH kinase family protein n=1 Tax=uncultured Flavonifractor sp. TaxID=1193534 RepID=UPI0026179F43|nr:CotH kinase family protein [uncultured Flavonifractor sp.]